jgi:hypothetical protein
VHSLPLVESDTPPVCGTLFFMELIIHSKVYGTHTVYYDAQDHNLVRRIKWSIAKGKNGIYYARGRVRNKDLEEIGQRSVRMHRLLLGATELQEVDHVDHNGLNNRKNNLRIVTNSQNSSNTRLHADSSTGFKGVTLRKKKGLYCPRIRVNGKLIHGKLTKNIYDAALQYNEMAVKYFGEYAYLNELSPEQLEQAKIKIAPKRVLSSNVTGYRGVCMSGNKRNPYAATIRVNGKNNYLGCYPTADIAAKVYNQAVISFNKPVEWLNIIPNE